MPTLLFTFRGYLYIECSKLVYQGKKWLSKIKIESYEPPNISLLRGEPYDLSHKIIYAMFININKGQKTLLPALRKSVMKGSHRLPEPCL